MADLSGPEAVYALADLFRERCLVEGRSFLWPDQYVWSAPNLRSLWQLVSGSDSLESIVETLKDQPKELQFIAVDVLAAGCFFPAVRRSTQERYFAEFTDAFDLPGADVETWNRLKDIFETEVPGSFTHYKGGKAQNYLSWLFGLMVMVEKDLADAGRETIVSTIEEESEPIGVVWNTLIWGLLHTIYPSQFAAVPGKADRRKIRRAYSSELEGLEYENDFAALDHLRSKLSPPNLEGPFDYYDVSILKRWDPKSKRIQWLERSNTSTPTDSYESLLGDERNSDSEDYSLEGLSATTHLGPSALEDIHDLLLTKRQLIFEGPPGSGKTFVAEKFARWFTGQPLDADRPLNEQVEIVQFHQSYGYEDFVQGIRPETNEQDQLVYRVKDGIFLKMCERATANPTTPFVLIIDEINRGNLSRIFGELLLLLEYRGMSARLPYGTGDAAQISIPDNLYIIGTMNTADRSLAQIDYALRRRFYFVRFMPVEHGRAEVFENWLATQEMSAGDRSRLAGIFVNLNHGIREHLNTDDLQVGHSYFMQDDIATEGGFNRVWNRAVAPLLNEYLHHHRNREEILAALTPQNLFSPEQEVEMPVDDNAGALDPELV